MRVCVCVCVRERDRGQIWGRGHKFMLGGAGSVSQDLRGRFSCDC